MPVARIGISATLLRANNGAIRSQSVTKGAIPKAEDFRAELHAQFARAQANHFSFIEIISGELHRVVGGYPGSSHRMPACCAVMRSAQRGGGEIVDAQRNPLPMTAKIWPLEITGG